ncbi:MAG: hypothetical protein IPM53_03070 [Anaerolineaceae bacterium]|nr:hypothetical protein [Anaerolineaceae bacterium]
MENQCQDAARFLPSVLIHPHARRAVHELLTAVWHNPPTFQARLVPGAVTAVPDCWLVP